MNLIPSNHEHGPVPSMNMNMTIVYVCVARNITLKIFGSVLVAWYVLEGPFDSLFGGHVTVM